MSDVEINSETLEAVSVVWDYLVMGAQPTNAQCLLVMGSYDIGVAEHAAHLMLTDPSGTLKVLAEMWSS